jgi:hypothetical protein
MLTADKGIHTSYRPPANLLARIASDRGVRTNTRTVIAHRGGERAGDGDRRRNPGGVPAAPGDAGFRSVVDRGPYATQMG